MDVEIKVRKLGLFMWEAEFSFNNSIYYFPAFTRSGALKRANRFLEEEL